MLPVLPRSSVRAAALTPTKKGCTQHSTPAARQPKQDGRRRDDRQGESKRRGRQEGESRGEHAQVVRQGLCHRGAHGETRRARAAAHEIAEQGAAAHADAPPHIQPVLDRERRPTTYADASADRLRRSSSYAYS